jgi:hypothetical protein
MSQPHCFLPRGSKVRKFQPFDILNNAPIGELEVKKHVVTPYFESQQQNHGIVPGEPTELVGLDRHECNDFS